MKVHIRISHPNGEEQVFDYEEDYEHHPGRQMAAIMEALFPDKETFTISADSTKVGGACQADDDTESTGKLLKAGAFIAEDKPLDEDDTLNVITTLIADPEAR